MIDREKIVKGLEECAGNGNCTKCQYGKEKQALSCKKLLADALSLLKEQEEVEPIFDNEGIPWCSGYWCGSCQESIVWHQKYCSECGRKVKWND